MARPTKRTAERQAAILRAIEIGATYEHAAAAAGVAHSTLSEWRKRNPTFAETLKEAEARGVVACLARIQLAAKEGQWQAAAWILERRHPQDYGRRDRLEVEHSGEVQLRQVIEARTVIMQALSAFPDARWAVADALEQLDAKQQAEQEGSSNGDR